MACATTSDSKRSAANTAGNGLPGGGITWKAPKQRSQHVGRQRCGLQFLPYAIHRIHGTDPFNKPGSCCHAGIDALPVGQAQASVIHLRALLSQLEYNRVLKASFGGNFWDSRSTGYKLSSPNAEQAQHPPVDPDEHGFPDTACIAYRLSRAEYRPLFDLVLNCVEVRYFV
jgi:hypothetical protein